MNKKLGLIILLSLIFVKFVYAGELTIVVPPNETGKDDLANATLDGDCVIMESKGETLLIDTCSYKNPTMYNSFREIIEDRQIKHVSVLISHFHEDHYGGLLYLLDDEDITIDKVYLPKTEYFCQGMNDANNIIAKEDGPYFLSRYKGMNKIINKINDKKIPIIFLWPTNTPYSDNNMRCFEGIKETETEYMNEFTFGDATVNIIGPVGNHYLEETAQSEEYNGKTITEWRIEHDCPDTRDCYTPGETNDSKSAYITKVGGDFINNMSLVAKITVDDTTIFTAGDIEIEEERALLKEYGNNLKSDIMKLSHHGTLSSNIEDFFKAIKPKYTYATSLYIHPAHAGNNMFNTSGNRFNYLINGDGINSTYRGANIYNAGYNGRIIILIKDNFIRARTQNNVTIGGVDKKNEYTITLKAIDQDGNKLVSQLHDFTLDTSDNYTRNVPFKIYNHIMPINGYFYQNDNIPNENNDVSTDTTYTINYKKALNVNDEVLSIDNDNLLIKTNSLNAVECTADSEELNYNKCHLSINEEKNNITRFDESSSTLTFLNANNHTNNNNYARTGDIIKISNSNQTFNYTFLLPGDITGDGWIRKEDAIKIAEHIINGDSEINKTYLHAGDMNDDSIIKMNDVIKIIEKIK